MNSEVSPSISSSSSLKSSNTLSGIAEWAPGSSESDPQRINQ